MAPDDLASYAASIMAGSCTRSGGVANPRYMMRACARRLQAESCLAAQKRSASVEQTIVFSRAPLLFAVYTYTYID